MDTKEQDKRWHLVRNDNGEWISEEHVVYVSALEATLQKIKLLSKVRHCLYSMDRMAFFGAIGMNGKQLII